MGRPHFGRTEPYVDKTSFPRKNRYVLFFLWVGPNEYGEHNVLTGRIEEFETKDALREFAKKNGLSATDIVDTEEVDWKSSGNYRVFVNKHYTFVDVIGRPLPIPKEFLETTEPLKLESPMHEEKML